MPPMSPSYASPVVHRGRRFTLHAGASPRNDVCVRQTRYGDLCSCRELLYPPRWRLDGAAFRVHHAALSLQEAPLCAIASDLCSCRELLYPPRWRPDGAAFRVPTLPALAGSVGLHLLTGCPDALYPLRYSAEAHSRRMHPGGTCHDHFSRLSYAYYQFPR